MGSLTLKNVTATFPIGTNVGLYEQALFDSGSPAPVGPPLDTSLVDANGDVAFSDTDILIDGSTYVAAAEVEGSWHFRRATTAAPSTEPTDLSEALQAEIQERKEDDETERIARENADKIHEEDKTEVHGIEDTTQLVTQDALAAALAVPAVTLFAANFATLNVYEFVEEQAPEERITVVHDEAIPVAQFELLEGDPEVAGGHRSEIRSGGVYPHGWDLIFAFGIKREAGYWPKFHISWQLHDESEGGSPPVCLMYKEIEGKKYLWIGPGDSSETWWKYEVPAEGNVWVDLVIRVKIGTADGEVQVWRDGVLQEMVPGGTVKENLDTEGVGPVYDKCGIYRSKDATGTSKVRLRNYQVLRRLP